MNKTTFQKKHDERIDADIQHLRKEYAENERFRLAMEEEYLHDPKQMKYSEGFYKVGDNSSLSKDTLLFPVRVIDGRKMFGKLQCLIKPICTNDGFLSSSPLGMRWVDRKFLILHHDHDFKKYESYLGIVDEEPD